jgi:hypothetical protein
MKRWAINAKFAVQRPYNPKRGNGKRLQHGECETQIKKLNQAMNAYEWHLE